MAAAAPIPQSVIAHLVEGITGPFAVGTALSTFLLGVTLTQCYTYYQRFHTDRAIFRWLVASLIVLDVSHTVCCWVTMWLWFVRHYGVVTSVAVSPWSFGVDPVMCGLAATLVQCFYAYRIYVLNNKNFVIPCAVIFLSLFQLGWATGATAEIFILQHFALFKTWTYGVACWLGSAAACDLLITSTLVYLLGQSRRSSAVASTNNIIDKLIVLTVETNGLTFACALIDIILFATRSDAAHVAPNLLLPKLYFNSLLVSLNSRAELSRNLGGSKSIQLKSVKSGDTSPNGSAGSTTIGGVHVLTTAAVSTQRVKEESYDEETQGRMRPDKNGYEAHVYGPNANGVPALNYDHESQREAKY